MTKIETMYLFLVYTIEKNKTFINLKNKWRGVDNLSILCYNISMINEIESFYFILSFVEKDNTRRIKPAERAWTVLRKPCAVALHIAKIQQLVRQFNKPRYRLEGIHLENHVVLLMLSCMFNTKNIYCLKLCLSYSNQPWAIIRSRE